MKNLVMIETLHFVQSDQVADGTNPGLGTWRCFHMDAQLEWDPAVVQYYAPYRWYHPRLRGTTPPRTRQGRLSQAQAS
jgi:hypothetical protein